MPYKVKYGKIELSPDEIKFIDDNWQTMTNPQPADALGLKLTKLRNILHEKGLKRIEMEYWTLEQIEFLKDNYQTIGDVELAELFSCFWHKNKGWSKNQIDKKRNYLFLKRTAEELELIKKRNVDNGRFAMCSVNMWITRGGGSEVGTIRIWKNSYNHRSYPVIKTDEGYVHYYRWLWESSFGKLSSEELVVPKKEVAPKKLFTLDDLEIIDRAEHAVRNAERRMEYPEDLKEIIKLRNKITKIIKKK